MLIFADPKNAIFEVLLQDGMSLLCLSIVH